MIIKDKTDTVIERRKARLGLSGDVYIYNHFIEDMKGHKKLIPGSTAQTIEEALEERIEYERGFEEERATLAAAKTEVQDDKIDEPIESE